MNEELQINTILTDPKKRYKYINLEDKINYFLWQRSSSNDYNLIFSGHDIDIQVSKVTCQLVKLTRDVS